MYGRFAYGGVPYGGTFFVTSGGTTYAVSVAEAGSAADTVSALAIFGGTLTETGALIDAVSALGVFGRTLTEAGALIDAVSTPAPPGTGTSILLVEVEFMVNVGRMMCRG